MSYSGKEFEAAANVMGHGHILFTHNFTNTFISKTTMMNQNLRKHYFATSE